MAFIVPDKILDKLTCNTCHKYLSVKPVKVYPNRHIKCGRCSRTKKQGDGVVSLFGLVAENSLFKCINRFDGCRELLTYSQVRDHEKTCQSRSSRCPICSESEEMTTYFLVKHFREKHKLAVLDYPGFIVKFDFISEISELYMYVLEDNLFFVMFQYSQPDRLMRLNISHNGDAKAASKIKQSFCLYSDSKQFKFCTKKKACTPFEANMFYSFSLDESDVAGIGKAIIVKFEIEKTDPTLIILPSVVIKSSGSGDSLDSVSIESLSLIESNVIPTAPYLPNVDPSVLRKIYLNEAFPGLFPDISLSNCGTAIIHARRLIFLQCFNCQEICWRGMSHDILVQQFLISITSRHSLCYYCFHFLQYEGRIKGDEYMLSQLPVGALKNIEFFCRWQCGATFVANEHLGHEESCYGQNFQECPVPKCYYMGKLVDISFHLKRHDAKLDICFYSNFYISSLFNRSIYVWVGGRFVLVNIISDQELHMSVNVCKDHDESRPVVLMFDDKKSFLMSFENSVTLNLGNYWIKVMSTYQ